MIAEPHAVHCALHLTAQLLAKHAQLHAAALAAGEAEIAAARGAVVYTLAILAQLVRSGVCAETRTLSPSFVSGPLKMALRDLPDNDERGQLREAINRELAAECPACCPEGLCARDYVARDVMRDGWGVPGLA